MQNTEDAKLGKIELKRVKAEKYCANKYYYIEIIIIFTFWGPHWFFDNKQIEINYNLNFGMYLVVCVSISICSDSFSSEQRANNNLILLISAFVPSVSSDNVLLLFIKRYSWQR